MNKLEANISLLAITFFAALQYVFLSLIPSSVSSFAFLCVTNLIGFLFALAFFAGELYRLEKKQILRSLVLAAELFGFNVFLLLGSSGMDAAVVSCVVTAYFVFIPTIMLLLREKVNRSSLAGIVLVLAGVFLVLEANLSNFLDPHILFLILADLCFALYMVTVERFSKDSNPSILAMGQMFFGFLIALVVWAAQSLLQGTAMTLPSDVSFWYSVIFISFFIRGLYGVVQIYAQRYVSALNASLIFSTEVIITLVLSPLLSVSLGTSYTRVTWVKVLGCIAILVGVLLADGTLMQLLKRGKRHEA